MNFKLPQIDLLSFWFGFALATIFWLVILRIARLLPKMRKSIALNHEKRELERSTDREHDLRKLALREAQTSHIANALFPLDKIMIEPKFMAKTSKYVEDSDSEHSASIYSVLPFMPEVPELTADLPALEYSFSDLLSTQQYISISGQSGMGKTTALAHLTSQLVVKEKPGFSELNYLPILIDYHNLIETETTPFESILDLLMKNLKGLSKEGLKNIFSHASSQKRMVLIIDGLDELAQSAFETAVQWIKLLQSELPDAIIVTTCSAYYTGSLESSGFSIYTLCAWGASKRHHFITMWKKAWLDYAKTLPNDQKIVAVEKYERTALWLYQDNNYYSPLDLTLKTWLSFAGGIQAPTKASLYKSFFDYLAGNNLSFKGLEMIARNATAIPYPYFNTQQFLETVVSEEDFLVQSFDESGQTQSNKSSNKNVDKNTLAQNVLSTLISSGLLKSITDEKISFNHLSFYAFLTSDLFQINPIQKLSQFLTNPVEFLRFKMTSPQQLDMNATTRWLNDPDRPLSRNLLIASSWLNQTSPNDPLRGDLFRRTALLLQDRTIPVELRYRFLYAITQTKDPTISSLLGLYRSNHDPSVRQISALGFGLIADDKNVPTLKELTKDNSNEVQQLACLSLGKIWSIPAQDALVDVIFSADESARKIACQILALHAPEGHQMLQEIIATDNYLARKAAITGLSMIKQPWVQTVLEKLSVEDTQWVVRDAAANALEHINTSLSLAPEHLLPVLENPWTLRKAEAHGVDLPASGFPTDLLYSIFEQDSLPDQIIALQYLLTQPNSRLMGILLNHLQQPQSSLTEEVINALFSLSKRGLEIQNN